MIEKARVSYWDNLKFLLIFLVSLGHFLLPISFSEQSNDVINFVYTFIYAFHMPAFVFVSGYFSKSFIKRGKTDGFSQVRTLLAYIILYLVFVSLLQVVSSLFTHNWKLPTILYIEGAPWYMLCMFLWLILLMIFQWFDWKISIFVAVGVALLFSINSNTGTFLSLSRCFVFFPFFLAGYYIEWDKVSILLTRRNKVIAIVVLAMMGAFIWHYIDKFYKYFAILYASHSYASVPTTIPKAIMLRAGWYALATIITLCVIILIPQRKMFVSSFGANTLGIYIFHRLAREVFSRLDMYRYFENSYILFGACIAISLACCFAFGGPRLNKILKIPFTLEYKFIKRREQD